MAFDRGVFSADGFWRDARYTADSCTDAFEYELRMSFADAVAYFSQVVRDYVIRLGDGRVTFDDF